MRRNSLSGGKRKRRRTLKHKRRKSHKSRKSHKRRTRVKRKRRRSRHRGGYSGAGNMILTPATFSPTNAYPPNGPVLVQSPGITKVATKGGDQQDYYQKNNKVEKDAQRKEKENIRNVKLINVKAENIEDVVVIEEEVFLMLSNQFQEVQM